MPTLNDDHVEAYLAAIERKVASVPDYRIALGIAAYRLAVFLTDQNSPASVAVQHFAERLLATDAARGRVDIDHLHGRLAVLLMDPEETEQPDLRKRLEAVTSGMFDTPESGDPDAAIH